MSRVYVCTNEVNRNFYFFLFVVPTRPRSLARPPYGPNAHPPNPPPTYVVYFVSSERLYSFFSVIFFKKSLKRNAYYYELTVCTVIAAFKNQISTCFLAMNRRRADCKCMHTITYYCTTTTTTLFSEIPSVIDPFYCCSSTSLDTIVIQRRGRRYVLFTEMSTFLRPQQLD
jgi:hypothetical protein